MCNNVNTIDTTTILLLRLIGLVCTQSQSSACKQAVVKVSRNAPERCSGAHQFSKEAFRGLDLWYKQPERYNIAAGP